MSSAVRRTGRQCMAQSNHGSVSRCETSPRGPIPFIWKTESANTKGNADVERDAVTGHAHSLSSGDASTRHAKATRKPPYRIRRESYAGLFESSSRDSHGLEDSVLLHLRIVLWADSTAATCNPSVYRLCGGKTEPSRSWGLVAGQLEERATGIYVTGMVGT